jgi:hypothetical protein
MKVRCVSFMLVVGLFGLFWGRQLSAADETTVTFSYGKIEVLKTGEQEWIFLEKGMKLGASDLVRMPPFSLIRLQTSHTSLPTLPGGREAQISALIREGVERKEDTRGRRIDEDFEGSPAVDVLPLGIQMKTDDPASKPGGELGVKVTPEELARLRRQLDALPQHVVSSVPSSFLSPVSEHMVGPSYPAPRFDRARRLYGELFNIEMRASNPPLPLLYAQMLRRARISVDLDVDANGELIVVFDSGISTDNARQMTANQQLIYKTNGAETVWIPVRVTSVRQTFTAAWYHGSWATAGEETMGRGNAGTGK